MADFYVMQNSAYPTIQETLTSQGKPLNLTPAVRVEFHAQRADGLAFSGTCVRDATRVGRVAYQLLPNQTTQPGVYRVWFDVVWQDDSQLNPPGPIYSQRIPAHRIMTLEIRP